MAFHTSEIHAMLVCLHNYNLYAFDIFLPIINIYYSIFWKQTNV